MTIQRKGQQDNNGNIMKSNGVMKTMKIMKRQTGMSMKKKKKRKDENKEGRKNNGINEKENVK